MAEQSSFDAVVVGAGPIGSAAARHLVGEVGSVALIGPVDAEPSATHVGAWGGWHDEGRMAHAIDLPLLSGLIGLRSRRRFDDLCHATGVEFAEHVPAVTVVPGNASGEDGVAATPVVAPDLADVDLSGDYFDVDGMLARAADLHVAATRLDEDGLRAGFPMMCFAPGHVGVHQPDALLISARKLVQAETAGAIAGGATRIVDEVVSWVRRDGVIELSTSEGRVLTAERVVLAAGAYLNHAGLSPRPLAFSTYGATVTLAEVADPVAARFPTTMYLKMTDEAPYAGIIAPPVRYPDGRWYIKGSGASLLDAPLASSDEIAAWVRAGGAASDQAPFAALLAELLPGVAIEGLSSRPCLVTLNDTGYPYLGLVDDGVVVATEGEHGVTMADELGRLAARLVIDGSWRDSLPPEPFTPRFRE